MEHNRIFMNSHNSIPVLILGFNRTEKLEKLLTILMGFGIQRIYIHLDGPKNEKDIVAINESISLINKIGNDNSSIELFLKSQSENLGCDNSCLTGISWFFENETKGIILEDDLIPSRSFFTYCEKALYKYMNNKQLFAISGFNSLGSTHYGKHLASFSRNHGNWGWATYRDRWQKFIKFLDFDNKNNDF